MPTEGNSLSGEIREKCQFLDMRPNRTRDCFRGGYYHISSRDGDELHPGDSYDNQESPNVGDS